MFVLVIHIICCGITLGERPDLRMIPGKPIAQCKILSVAPDIG